MVKSSSPRLTHSVSLQNHFENILLSSPSGFQNHRSEEGPEEEDDPLLGQSLVVRKVKENRASIMPSSSKIMVLQKNSAGDRTKKSFR